MDIIKNRGTSDDYSIIYATQFINPLEPCQYAVHSLAAFIDSKNKGCVGKLGARALLLFVYPIKLIDRTIQLLAAPIISIISCGFEMLQNRKNRTWCQWIAGLILLPIALPLYTAANIAYYAIYLVGATLNIFSPILALCYGAKASQHYFAQHTEHTELCKKQQKKDDEANKDHVAVPYVALPIPSFIKEEHLKPKEPLLKVLAVLI